MTVDEALNVAWHVRVNGLDVNIRPEQIKEAFAAFEAEVRRLRRWVSTATSDSRIAHERAANSEAKLARVEAAAGCLPSVLHLPEDEYIETGVAAIRAINEALGGDHE